MSGIPQVTLSLADFADGAALTTTAKIRGKEVNVRPLSLHEKNILIAAHPAPTAPLKKPTDKGTLAGLEHDVNDPDYVAASRIHVRERSVLSAAASAGYRPAPTEVGLAALNLGEAAALNRAGQWVKQTLIEWQGNESRAGMVTEADVVAINTAVDALETAGSLGNSSAPAAAKASGAKAGKEAKPAS